MWRHERCAARRVSLRQLGRKRHPLAERGSEQVHERERGKEGAREREWERGREVRTTKSHLGPVLSLSGSADAQPQCLWTGSPVRRWACRTRKKHARGHIIGAMDWAGVQEWRERHAGCFGAGGRRGEASLSFFFSSEELWLCADFPCLFVFGFFYHPPRASLFFSPVSGFRVLGFRSKSTDNFLIEHRAWQGWKSWSKKKKKREKKKERKNTLLVSLMYVLTWYSLFSVRSSIYSLIRSLIMCRLHDQM